MSFHIDEPVLRTLYVEEKLTGAAIARQLGCDRQAVVRHLRLYGIPIRKRQRTLVSCKMCGKTYARRSGGKLYCSQKCRSEDRGINSTELEYTWKEWRYNGRSLADIGKELHHTKANLWMAMRRYKGKEAEDWGPISRAQHMRKQSEILAAPAQERLAKYDEEFVAEILDYYAQPKIRLEPEVVSKYGISKYDIRFLAHKFFPKRWAEIAESKHMDFVEIYVKGRRFEYRVWNELSKMGYWIIRSAGSYGLADLVALKMGSTLLVQCKLGGNLRRPERIKLIELANSVGAKAVKAWCKRDEVVFDYLN